MHEKFWLACWERNSLGFHQHDFHPFLEQEIKERICDSDQRVFVPLCGKSIDMVWFAQFADVVGAELSEIACQDFFSEKNMSVTPVKIDNYVSYIYKNIQLLQGDFFALNAESVGQFNCIYDRAALIALPTQMQKKYVQRIKQYIQQDTKLFLVSLEFPEGELEGPPFPVFQEKIEQLFSEYSVELIAEHNLESKQFAQRQFDVTYLVEKLYLITRQ